MKHKLETACGVSFVFVVLVAFVLMFCAMVSSGKKIKEREARWNSVAISAGQNRQVLAIQRREIERLEFEVLRLNGIMDCFLDHFEDCKRLQERGE